MATEDAVRRWQLHDLVGLVPGSSPKVWRTDYVPSLIAAGALHKRGRGWLGRRSDIEAALLGTPAQPGRGRRV